jgi:hypothetical protein
MAEKAVTAANPSVIPLGCRKELGTISCGTLEPGPYFEAESRNMFQEATTLTASVFPLY